MQPAHLLPPLILALAASASAQSSLTRTFEGVSAIRRTLAGVGADTLRSHFDRYTFPDVAEESGVTMVGASYAVASSRNLTVSATNNDPTAGSFLYAGITDWDAAFVIGSPSSVGWGFDGCSGCNSSLFSRNNVPFGTTVVLQQGPGSFQFQSGSVAPGGFAWGVVRDTFLNHAGTTGSGFVDTYFEYRGDPLNTNTSLLETEHRLTLGATMRFEQRTAGVTLVGLGLPNSTGSGAELSWFGGLRAGTGMAAVRASALPVGVPTACIITDDFDPAPPGVGTQPVVHLRGMRGFQEVQASALGASGAGEATFDVNLAGFQPGDTFAVQVLYRDGGSWNATGALVGTAQ